MEGGYVLDPCGSGWRSKAVVGKVMNFQHPVQLGSFMSWWWCVIFWKWILL